MKKVSYLLGFLTIITFSVDFIIGDRAQSWNTIPKENLVDESYTVFVKDKLSSRLLIRAYARSKGIDVSESQIFVEGAYGFVADLNEQQIDALKGWFYWLRAFTDVRQIRPNFRIQSTRARMQSDPIPQSTRARMQSDYDVSYQTSNGVIFVGGPEIPPNLNRKVWVIDTGIDSSHPDLAAQVVLGGQFAKSFVQSEPNPYEDGNGHGTFSAGLIGAKSTDPTDEFVRMNGVAPGAKLVSVKVLNNEGEGSWGTVLLGLSHALINSSPGDIISLSLGGDFPEACDFFNRSWFKNFRLSVKNKGVLVVMSAGNLGEDMPGPGQSSTINFPGCLTGENFIAVGSISVSGELNSVVEFSNFSYMAMPAIDYVAPGKGIFSTTKDQVYEIRSGTSASAAIVSGIIYARGGLPLSNETIRGIGTDETDYPVAKVKLQE
ncbi:S8 family peptidase [Algoriphagus jejuensis]